MGSFMCFLDPKVWLGFVIAVTLSFMTGCQYGKDKEHKANEAAKAAATITAYTNVRTIEQNANESQNNVATTFEDEMQALRIRADSLDLDRLRVTPRTCASLPAVSPTASGLNGTGTGAAYGVGTGEVNLDGVARQVKQLGVDLDAARTKVKGLQSLVKTYQSVCGNTVER